MFFAGVHTFMQRERTNFGHAVIDQTRGGDEAGHTSNSHNMTFLCFHHSRQEFFDRDKVRR